MEIIRKNFNRNESNIGDKFRYDFDIPEKGIYLIEITASARNWWQNFKKLRSFFKDDDLAVAIDGREFPKLNGKRGLFDGEVAWNGNNLKGLKKTGVFIIKLSKGSHSIVFTVDQHPALESILINRIEGGRADYVPEGNNPPENGDRRQWISIALVDLPLKNLSIRAKADYFSQEKDGDDLKLVIDGKIQENEIRKDFRNWYWCGMELRGREKEFDQELNLESGLHYIELWADRTPELENMILELEEKKIDESSNDPIKIEEGFNPVYVIKDSAFLRNDSMSEDDIQTFLDSYHKDLEKSHISKTEFDGKKAAFWIKKSADENSINPKLLLVKLQAERNLIKGEKSVDPTRDQLDWAMGVGVLDENTKLPQFQGLIIQINSAAKYFRQYYNESQGINLTHEVEGKPFKVLNAATYTLYKYTPFVDGARLVYDVYFGFFGKGDLGGPTETKKVAKTITKLALLAVFLAGACFFVSSAGRSLAGNISGNKQVLDSYSENVNLDDGFKLVSKVDIYSEREATMDDGLYCGFRYGKIYESTASLGLYRNGRLIESVGLSDPELFFPNSTSGNLSYYEPQDIDGDGKKQEFIVAEYENCNGNKIRFLRYNTDSGKIEEIGITTRNNEDTNNLYVDISSKALMIDNGIISTEYYQNVDLDSRPVGFYRNYYKFDRSKNRLVWFEKGE
ncbi:MAG: hypothetical protein HGB08_02270 [Candidatus Moranbacteria bacterium]|nr:hypothetical protein [Candidatus Moranbacteria bacterium]